MRVVEFTCGTESNYEAWLAIVEPKAWESSDTTWDIIGVIPAKSNVSPNFNTSQAEHICWLGLCSGTITVD